MECHLENLTVHYTSIGEGRPVLLLHGATLDHRHMVHDLEPAFTHRRGWRRIYLDLPGHGRTSAPASIISQDDVLEVVLSFIDKVIPGQRFSLVGMSWGGRLSRAVLAKRFDWVDGMCLIVTPIMRHDDEPEPVVLIANQEAVAEADALDQRAGDVMRMQPVQMREVLNWWVENSRPAKDLWDRDFGERFFNEPNIQLRFDINQLPHPFPGPVLLVMGRQDPVVRYTDIWPIVEIYPRATVALLDRAGHLLAVHQRALFTALVNEWLDRVEEYASS